MDQKERENASEKVNEVLAKLTKGSLFNKRQEQRELEISSKVEVLKSVINEGYSKGEPYLRSMLHRLNEQISELESNRILSETWIHVDMDMFYASVEIRDNPSIADKPVAVGINNMVNTANYIARQYGVKSGVPGFVAKRICPELVYITPDYPKYKQETERIREIFREYDPCFESLGMDEAYLWVTPLLIKRKANHDQGRQEIAEEIRGKIYGETKLTASAGIACNKMLAKIATDINKPNGQCYVPFESEQIKRFIADKSIRKIVGIGKVLQKELNGLGVLVCQDIIDKKLDLFFAYSSNLYKFFIESALGISRVLHNEDHETKKKSTGLSLTFKPTSDSEFVEKVIDDLAQGLDKNLEEMKVSAKTVSVSLETATFLCYSKAESLKRYINKYSDIIEVALRLLRSFYPLELLRMVRVTLSNFTESQSIKSIKAYAQDQEVKEFKCEKCNQTLSTTEQKLKMHTEMCGVPAKRKKIVSNLDRFIKKSK